ncbi:permease [Nonomuraea gerenzanensis]|uniref:Permease n=1 Tax=Nonomuraea gerenzanensis TaxID=93944 RepID=A0A1M4EB74_9ACTN|nr:permease [Nonomuraea gerenzanensis]UBU18333.1 permease [Nonomuraea gerenzanensis]SBO96159.1 permease [Nonomuraea gerenzanensis]
MARQSTADPPVPGSDGCGSPRGSGGFRLPWAFLVLVALLAAGRFLLAPYLTQPALQTWATVFVAVCVQALPFLVLGVALSAAITAFVPASFWTRALPRRTYAAVPVAGLAGAVLPGCECASVPVASGLMARGVAPPAALAFLLASPAINPVVLVATAVAFPDDPAMVAARFAASLAVAVLAGWIWARFGRAAWLPKPRRAAEAGGGRMSRFVDAMHHDLLHAGGFLVVGALAAATLNVVIPRDWLTALAGVPVVSVLVLAFLAVLLSICSEADAFVAASFTAFSPTAKLAFLVVGPMVDLKLIALQVGTFGRSFAWRFAPLTLVLAVGVSFVAGRALL